MTTCAKNMGWLQPMVPVAGVHTIGEIEILHALNDPDAMVVDMRRHEDRVKGTIPGSFSIPYTEATKHMELFGCKKNGDSYDCKEAKKVYGFCNGPVCPQSPMAMAAIVKKGFPPEKIYYYRGGMLDWEALGLTVEVKKR
jgi:rhodanese-related sulfurtransferase